MIEKIFIENLKKCQRRFGIENIDLLTEVFTHRSFSRENNYERLEFLGDSVLSLAVSKILFQRYPLLDEASLSKLRMRIVCGENLATISDSLSLALFIRAKGVGIINAKLREDVLEALIGSIFIDKGFEAAIAFVEEYFNFSDFKEDELYYRENLNYKGVLQEAMQINGFSVPSYHSTIIGDDFDISCTLDTLQLSESARAKNKKQAEQLVAKALLHSLLEKHKDRLTYPKSLSHIGLLFPDDSEK